MKLYPLRMKFILPILLFLSSVCMAHPIHVSVCEINHNVQKGVLEVTIRIFSDDFEDVLEDRTGVRTKLGTSAELAKTNDYIMDYLRDNFSIIVNDTLKSLVFVTKEFDEFATICKLYVPRVKTVSSMTITNELMLHWFSDQVNVTHIDCNDELKSTFFAKGRAKETFRWKPKG
jgi:hypothetical protein